MQDSPFESSIDSPSDWVSLDIELKEKIISQVVSDYNQKEKTIPHFVPDDIQKEAWRESLFRQHPSPKPQAEQTEMKKSPPSQSNQCCAFQKLDEILKSTVENDDACMRLVLWTTICRNKDSHLDDFVKRSCPLAKCTFSCDPGNGDLMKHMLSCSFRKYGTYRCPYCKKVEEFTISYRRRPRKPWSRTKSLRDAFHNICELGSKGIHKALCHSNKRQRYETPDDNSTDSESTTSETKADLQTTCSAPTNDIINWSEKPMLRAQKSQALQARIQSQVREIDDPNMVSELESDIYWELPVAEIPAVQQDVLKVLTTFESSDTETYIPTPLSSPYISSSERFGSPISPQDVQPLVELVEAMKSSSGKQASLSAMRLEWPVNQKQTLQPTPTLSVTRAANERRRARGMQNLCIDTSCARSRSVTPARPDTPASISEEPLSSPDNPEVLCYEPITLFHQLRNTFYNTYKITYAQLSISPRLPINQEIIDMQMNPADVFLSGWAVVEVVLKGQLPQNFWSLFALAQLAFTCGQVVWEDKLKYQIDDIVDELKIWSHALRDLRERRRYQEVIEQIFVKKDRKLMYPRESRHQNTNLSPASSMSYGNALSLDGRQLLAILRDGVVIRLCSQFLSTHEFLQYRAERNKKPSMSSRAGLIQATYSHNNADILDSLIIRPLLAADQFLALEPIIEKATKLLCDYPNTTSRELEVFLYYTRDHTLHLQFRQAIAEACSDAGLHEPVQYLLDDISSIRQCQKDLALFQEINPTELHPTYTNDETIPELHGSPVEVPFPHFTYTTQSRSSCVYPRSGPGRRHYQSPIHTPTSANTTSPSTATSTQAPSIFTPISGYSASPATATEPAFTYESMDWQASIPEETHYTDFDLQLAVNDDYTLLTNDAISTEMISSDIISNDLSLFNTDIPTNAGLPAGPEAKASRSCHICGKVFTSKEQHLSSNLQRHMREQHSSAKGITCDICHKVFKRKHNLKVHMNTVHSQDRNSTHSHDRNSVHSQGWS